MKKKAMPVYEIIKERVATSKVVGGDETGIKINGNKAWFWYAVIRSVIDTTIKNSQNVFKALSCLADQKLIGAEL